MLKDTNIDDSNAIPSDTKVNLSCNCSSERNINIASPAVKNNTPSAFILNLKRTFKER